MTSTTTTASSAEAWFAVCGDDDLPPGRGVAALVGDQQVALFRTHDGEVFAVGNRDPFSGAYVISRGIVGSRGDAPTVASPMYKDVFDLRTGHCLADPAAVLPTFRVRREGDRILVRASPVTRSNGAMQDEVAQDEVAQDEVAQEGVGARGVPEVRGQVR